MLADNKVVHVSLAAIPAVVLYERDRGNNVPVLYVLVRTDYGETDEAALKRAYRIAEWLTDEVAIRKSSKHETNHKKETEDG